MAEAFPELVSTDSEGYPSLAYPQLNAVLLRALQEQQVEIEAAADRIARLEDVVQRLVAGGAGVNGPTNAEHQGS